MFITSGPRAGRYERICPYTSQWWLASLKSAELVRVALGPAGVTVSVPMPASGVSTGYTPRLAVYILG